MQQISKRRKRSGIVGDPTAVTRPVTVFAAGAVCWRVVDGKIEVLLDPPHRTTTTSPSPRARSTPARRCPQTAVREIAEETGLAGRPRRAARRHELRDAERPREGRALLGGRGHRRGHARLDVRAERRDRRARVGDGREGPAPRSPTSATSRSSSASRQLVDDGRHQHLRPHRAAARQGHPRIDFDGPRRRPPAHRARSASRHARSSPASSAFGARRSSGRRTAVRCQRPSRRSPRRSASTVKTTDCDQPGRVRGRHQRRARVVGKRVRRRSDERPVQPRTRAARDHARDRPRHRQHQARLHLPGRRPALAGFSVVHLSATTRARASSPSRRTRRSRLRRCTARASVSTSRSLTFRSPRGMWLRALRIASLTGQHRPHPGNRIPERDSVKLKRYRRPRGHSSSPPPSPSPPAPSNEGARSERLV